MSEESIERKKVLALQELQQHEGWGIVCESLKEDLSITEAKLFGEMKLEEHETIEMLQRERIDRLDLLDLPQNLIKELTEEESEAPDLEVY